MARPTNWSLELEEKAWHYVDHYADYDDAFPSVVGLCKVLDRAKSTIYDWAGDESKGFSDILAAIMENQERVTLNKAIVGDYNAAIAKLVLGKHGYHDKQDNTHSGVDGSPIEVDHQWTVNIVG